MIVQKLATVKSEQWKMSFNTRPVQKKLKKHQKTHKNAVIIIENLEGAAVWPAKKALRVWLAKI